VFPASDDQKSLAPYTPDAGLGVELFELRTAEELLGSTNIEFSLCVELTVVTGMSGESSVKTLLPVSLLPV
jgi:hypothetical protein